MTEVCRLVAAPGNAFTFVSPPAGPQFDGLARFALGATQIDVTYVGFDAFPAAQAAFQHAVNIWAGLISSPVPIKVRAEFKALGGGILGSAGTNYIWRDFAGAPIANSWYGDALADKLRGSDSYAAGFDISANFNSTYSNWYFGTDGATPGGQYDFVSVVLHELGHGFGFHGSASYSSGTGQLGISGYPMAYDRFTVSENFTPLLAFANPSTALGTQLTSGYNGSNPRGPGAYWGGPNGMSANGGITARLYTPTTWAGGSSYSHLDDSAYVAGNPNSLMTHAISSAEAIHHPGPVTLGVFTDLGWNISIAAPANNHDFDGDGDTDLIFENASGQHYVWFMSGTAFTGGGFLAPNPIDANLQVAGVNDFTGDGKADLLLQHATNRTVTLYKMNGLSKTGEQSIQAATNTPWTVVATGDFNGDSHADIVWENFTTGQIYIWFMSASGGNATYAGAGGAFSGNYVRDAGQTIIALGATSLRVVGADDLNNDGKTDLVFQDDNTGLLRVWLLDGTTRLNDVAPTPAGASSAWKLRAVSDLNGDSRPDFLWQNVSTGDLYTWFMNGVTFTSGSYLSPTQVNPSWRVSGPR